ncbi:Myelin expression factor 2 [Papilio xuthus]|uniref:Myelin expression factor 2 n=1 Tax=Papilio xuthus TaxID=66420 RepID=A0A194QHZ1_PAPXU|nr:Myelin expression factor 2 [Papilio xuthus]
MAGVGKNSSKKYKKYEATKDDSSDKDDNNRKRRNECVTQNDSLNSSAKRKKSEGNTTVNPKQEKDVSLEEGKELFSLLVSNIPYQWTFEQIKDYLNENSIDVNTLEKLEGGNLERGQKIELTFTNFEQCNKARKQLKLKAIDGKKLDIVYKIPGESDSGDDMDMPLVNRRTSRPLPTWESIDIWAEEPTGTYGLKPSYLESLGIKLPIDKWIHVSNFRCDKSELKEVLELAGQVVICRVISAFNKYATVMYSHPLEAVQAVAMLNGQTFYGQVLKVLMYRCEENDLLLPKGLVKVGPGLGIGGKPLRDIVQHYERYLNGKVNCINETIFNIPNDIDFNEQDDNDENIKEEIDISENNNDNQNNDNITNNDDQNNDNAINATNESETSGNAIPKKLNISMTITQNLRRPDIPLGPSSAPVHPNGVSNIRITQFLQQPATSLENKSFRPGINQPGYIALVNNPGPVYVSPQNMMATTRLPQIVPVNPRIQIPGPFHGPRPQGPGPQGPRPQGSGSQGPLPPGNTNGWCGPPLNRPPNRNVCLPQITSSVVELSNLPLSTTFPTLSEKMSLVGQVISLELTRVGCALVRFATPAHAERCYCILLYTGEGM